MYSNLKSGHRISITKGLGVIHYGIYSGKGMVIDNSNAKGGVTERHLTEFAGSRKISPIQITTNFPPHEVVARARERIGKRYGWFNQNCEHFVNEVQLGVPKSAQALVGGGMIAFTFWRLFIKNS